MKIYNKDFLFLKSKGFLVLIILFVFILIMSFFFGDSGIVEIVRVQEKIENLKTNIVRLENEKASLTEEVEKLKNNPLALEKKAREKLWLMKKNEKVVVIVKNRNKNKERINSAGQGANFK